MVSCRATAPGSVRDRIHLCPLVRPVGGPVLPAVTGSTMLAHRGLGLRIRPSPDPSCALTRAPGSGGFQVRPDNRSAKKQQ